MARQRVEMFYSGRVQGVGFRYSVKALVAGFEVVGTVRNLSDGRVELVAEGERDELEAFLMAITESGLRRSIRGTEIWWGEPLGKLSGFEIVA